MDQKISTNRQLVLSKESCEADSEFENKNKKDK